MKDLERGDVLVLKRSGTRVMVRRIENGEQDLRRVKVVVLWAVDLGVELNGRHALDYLLERLADGTIRKGRRLDAARVIHEATVRNRQRGLA